jgi:hypothetical protein
MTPNGPQLESAVIGAKPRLLFLSEPPHLSTGEQSDRAKLSDVGDRIRHVFAIFPDAEHRSVLGSDGRGILNHSRFLIASVDHTSLPKHWRKNKNAH